MKLPTRSALREMENVVLRPRIAFTTEARERVLRAVCRHVEAVLDGHRAGDAAGPLHAEGGG